MPDQNKRQTFHFRRVSLPNVASMGYLRSIWQINRLPMSLICAFVRHLPFKLAHEQGITSRLPDQLALTWGCRREKKDFTVSATV